MPVQFLNMEAPGQVNEQGQLPAKGGGGGRRRRRGGGRVHDGGNGVGNVFLAHFRPYCQLGIV